MTYIRGHSGGWWAYHKRRRKALEYIISDVQVHYPVGIFRFIKFIYLFIYFYFYFFFIYLFIYLFIFFFWGGVAFLVACFYFSVGGWQY